MSLSAGYVKRRPRAVHQQDSTSSGVQNDLKLAQSKSDRKLVSDMMLNCWYRSEMTLNYVMVHNDLKLAGPQ